VVGRSAGRLVGCLGGRGVLSWFGRLVGLRRGEDREMAERPGGGSEVGFGVTPEFWARGVCSGGVRRGTNSRWDDGRVGGVESCPGGRIVDGSWSCGRNVCGNLKLLSSIYAGRLGVAAVLHGGRVWLGQGRRKKNGGGGRARSSGGRRQERVREAVGFTRRALAKAHRGVNREDGFCWVQIGARLSSARDENGCGGRVGACARALDWKRRRASCRLRRRRTSCGR
jgi:hypothetical protein